MSDTVKAVILAGLLILVASLYVKAEVNEAADLQDLKLCEIANENRAEINHRLEINKVLYKRIGMMADEVADAIDDPIVSREMVDMHRDVNLIVKQMRNLDHINCRALTSIATATG